jgi:hypothetical protein
MTGKDQRTDRPIEELKAGDAFRESMIPRADLPGPYPLWHGWVIMDAFLAGIDYARVYPNCPQGDHDAQGRKMEDDAEERRQLEEAEMAKHYNKYPHG